MSPFFTSKPVVFGFFKGNVKEMRVRELLSEIYQRARSSGTDYISGVFHREENFCCS